MTPDSPPTATVQRKMFRDHITAHKIALLTLIKEFCNVKSKSRCVKPFQQPDENMWVHTNQQNREFAITMLKLIQNPDMDLKRLNNIVHPILHPNTYQLFIDRLQELRKQGLAGIMDYIQTLEPLLVDPAPCVPIVHKSSVLGLFIRRMLLAFDKLSFSLVTKLCNKFFAYYDAAFGCISESLCTSEIGISEPQDSEEALEDSDFDEIPVLASQKQAEFFIAQQAALLQINENEALSPLQLQQKIRELLKGNPELAEAHYLSFLNSLRVKEYCGAIENLYHHFDRNTSVPQDSKVTPVSEDATRSFRYAALNLAVLYARFGHKEEAFAALSEAIMLAQEVNDNICLQHALTWLYRLSSDNTEILIERSVSKSGELNLWYLSSLGVQALAQKKSVSSDNPAHIFDLEMKSDILNCQHSMTELMGSAYAQRAALWTYYGNNCMASLVSQLLLHLNTSDPIRGGVYHIGEGTCLAIRNLAQSFALEGQICLAGAMLDHAKELFPAHTEHSHVWKFCEQIMKFEKALYHGRWQEAKKVVIGVEVINADEAQYRRSQLLVHEGNEFEAFQWIKKSLSELEKQKSAPYFHVRTLLLKAQLLCRTSNYTQAIPPLMICLSLCKNNNLLYYEALTILHLASVQLMLNLPNQALHLLDQIFITLLSHGSNYDKGCLYLTYAKCTVASAQMEESAENRMKAMHRALKTGNRAIDYFMSLDAVHRAKDAICWQCHVYNELGMTSERNSFAYLFKNLDQQFSGSNWNGVLVP